MTQACQFQTVTLSIEAAEGVTTGIVPVAHTILPVKRV